MGLITATVLFAIRGLWFLCFGWLLAGVYLAPAFLLNPFGMVYSGSGSKAYSRAAALATLTSPERWQ